MSSRILVNEIYGKTSNSKALEINDSGLLMPKNVVMQVEAINTDQSIVGANVLVEWETVEVDTCSGWDATNERYKPTVAGWYLFGGVLRASFTTTNSFYSFRIFKNGSFYMSSQHQSSADDIIAGEYMLPSGMVYMNGSTDYIDLRVEGDEAYVVHDHATRPSKFWAMLVHNA